MRHKLSFFVKYVIIGIFAFIVTIVGQERTVMAAGYGLTVAPMNQKILLESGDSYRTSFSISNPSNSTDDTYYRVEVGPFYVDSDGNVINESEGDHGRIADWVSFDVPTEGILKPNEAKDIIFTINVPESAPAGGQYLSVQVTASAEPVDEKGNPVESSGNSSGAVIREIKKVAHLVYADVAGDTIRRGEILEVNLPSFLMSGKITGSAVVKNTGNVHSEAKYTLQVYPLFSNEAIFTNEEDPSTRTVLPDRTLYNAISWDGTPGIGIFNVVYTVEFEGSTAEVKKMVIVCPLWLLFIIVFAIVVVIIWLVLRAKSRRTRRAE